MHFHRHKRNCTWKLPTVNHASCWGGKSAHNIFPRALPFSEQLQLSKIINNVPWFFRRGNQQWDIRSIHFIARLLVCVNFVAELVELKSREFNFERADVDYIAELLRRSLIQVESGRKLPIKITSTENQQFSLDSELPKIPFGMYVMRSELRCWLEVFFSAKKFPRSRFASFNKFFFHSDV